MGEKRKVFQPGDLVRHKSSFLQSICWYTDVPINGKVISNDGYFTLVEWCDQEEPKRICTSNLERYT